MSTLGNFFIFNKVRSWVICIIITLFGIVSYQKLQLRPYPKTGDNDILVEIQSAGSPPDVIENTIGKIVENALASTPGLQKRTSECRYGRYRCFLRFEGLSLIEALYNVQQRIASVRNDLPSQLREPVIRSISKSDEERETIAIAVFDKTGEEDRSSKLAKYAADYKSFFESINGIANVFISGENGSHTEDAKEVYLIPDKLIKYNVSAYECFEAISEANFITSAGECNLGPTSIPVSMSCTLQTQGDIKDVVVKTDGGNIIRIRDVAIVGEPDNSRAARSTFNGKACANILLYTKSDADLLQIGNKVREKLDTVKELIPNPNIQMEIYYDQTKIMADSVSRAKHSIIEAIILVICVVMLFLGSVRASVAVIIPLFICIVSGFFIMWVLGFTINLMTLTAIILAVALGVDDAIVVLERIESRMKQYNETALESALKTMDEILPSLIGMTLTLTSVYTPIIFMSGVMGIMFKEFALTLAGMIIVSGVIAFILTPVIAIWALSGHSVIKTDKPSLIFKVLNSASGISQYALRILNWLEGYYLTSLRFVLHHKYSFTLGFTAFFLSTFLIPKYALNNIMVPEEDQSNIAIQIQVPSKFDVRFTKLLVDQIEEILSINKDISSITSTINPGFPARLDLRLISPDKRQKNASTIAKEIEEKLAHLTKDRITTFTTCTSPFDKGDNATFYLTSNDRKTLEEICNKVIEVLSQSSDFTSKPQIRYSSMEKEPGLAIIFEPECAGKFAIKISDIRRLVRTALSGNPPATYLYMGNNRPAVSVKRSEAETSEQEAIWNIKKMPVTTGLREHKGQFGQVTLGNVANVVNTSTESSLNKENGLTSVSFTVSGTEFQGVELYEVCQKIVKQVLPKTVLMYAGEKIQNLYKERGSFLFSATLALFFVYLFMAALFESFLQPIIAMLCVFPTFSGVFLALYFLKDGSINIWSNISILTLIGLMTRISILMAMYFNMEVSKFEKSTLDDMLLFDIAVRSAAGRFKPVVMTTLIAILGAIPLLTGKSTGYEAFRQIGASLIGGLSVGTFLTMYLIPIACVYFYNFQRRAESIDKKLE